MAATILHIKHGPEKPYVILDKATLWDKRLSLKAIGLWARLMSRPDDWIIRASELAKSCNLNEDTIYRIIKELIDAGFAYRRKNIDPKTGRIISWETFVFEVQQSTEQIQKMFPEPKKPDLEKPDLENQGTTNIDSTYKEKTDISLVDDGSPTTQIPIQSEKKEEKKVLPIEIWNATNHLWGLVLKFFPKHKPPKLDRWAYEIDLMHRVDKRSWEDMQKVIDFAFEDSFWVQVIQSPTALRRNFDKLMAKMTPVDNSGARQQKNRAIAQEMKSAVKNNERKWKNFYISTDKVVRLDTNESVELFLEPKLFEAQMIRIFGLTKD